MARTKDESLKERDRRICLLRRNGFTYAEIADMEGVSRVRVSQIVHEANAEVPEEETRAEIASILEFAERKAVELINDPGYALAPNGRAATGPDGEPILNKGIVGDALRTLVVIADRKARLYAADKPAKRPAMSEDEANRAAMESIARLAAQKELEDRQRAADIARWEGLRIIQGSAEPVERPELPPAAEG